MEVAAPSYDVFCELTARYRELHKRLEALQSVAQALTEVPTDFSSRIMAPIHPMCLVPAHLVHTNEVLVPMPDGSTQWMTAPQAVRVALARAEAAETELAQVSLQLRGIGMAPEGIQLPRAAQEFGRKIKRLGPSATEVEVGGEKLVYIEEFEEDDRVGASSRAAEPDRPMPGGVPLGQLIQDALRQQPSSTEGLDEAELWRDFDASVKRLEEREAALEAADAAQPVLTRSPGNPFAPAAPTQAEGQPDGAAAAQRRAEESAMESSSVLGSVRERRQAGAASAYSAGETADAAPPASTRPVSKFKLDRMARQDG